MVETAHADPLLGSMLGKDYHVLECIGAGGMAVVYLVEHQTLQKRFAAKVLRTEHASSAEARARFTLEAHAASQLDHENIVTISDFGVTPDQRPFFVMELLRGKTLADRIDEGQMTLEEVVAVCVPAARALAHAHAEGIVHRDVKPENIMLVQRSQGRWSVKVLDFGIAKVEENDSMTKTGQAIGSPMYMAPEACRGDDVDMRADVYSFGVVLYLMFAGRVPFSDDNILKVLQMQVSSPVPPPTKFAPHLPLEIEAVILKALAKDVDERYSNMEELLAALEDALPQGADVLLLQAQFGAGATPFPGSLERVRAANMSGNFRIQHTGRHEAQVSPAPTPLPTRPPAPPRNRSWMAALGAVVVLGGIGGGYMMLTGRDGSKTASPSIVPAPAPTPPAVATAPRVAPTPPAVVDDVAHVETVAAVVPDTRDTQVKQVKTAPRNVRLPAPPARVGKDKKAPSIVTTAPATTEPVTPVAISTTTGPSVEVLAPKQKEPPPTPTPLPTPIATPKVTIGSLDATPTIATLNVEGSLPSSVVRRSIERVLPSLQSCYRTAAKAKSATPAVNVKVRFVIDENGAARSVAASGNFAALADCVKGSVSRVQSPTAPDVGTVSVAVGFNFTPT